MKLSIIIPYYNTKEYTDELIECLDKQIIGTPGVEVILIDDGSPKAYKAGYKWLSVIRTKNQGQAAARNRGLKCAKGEYIQFIDSDDMVSPHFVRKLLEKIEDNPELIEYSWRSLNMKGAQFDYKVKRQGDRLSNPSACTRCFKRSLIGNIRFNEQKDATEDEDFSRRVGYLSKDIKTAIIPEYMYFYRTDVSGSNTKNYKNGQTKTKRIVYYFHHVTADMTDLLEEIKKEDETNEVILLTYQNDIPELSRWCQIYKPTVNTMWAHYLRGEPYRGCAIIPIPEQHDVILFIRGLHVIGGIESFIYHFGELMKDRDIVLVVGSVDIRQRKRLEEHIKVIDYDYNKMYACDTLIMLRILDKTPDNIRRNQSVRMCHGCKTNPQWFIPADSDFIVNVSAASKKTFEEAKEAMVIHNPITKTDKKALIFVSATRIPAPDKGNNERRMRELAERLNEAGIPFIWFNFSEGVIPNAPRGMVNMGLEMDVQPYIAAADYLVQLSDSEAWSYSMLEALTNNVPVICCPFPSAEEMGVIDGQNGYVIPFDMGFDVHKLLKVPQFEFDYDNKAIKKAWDKILDHKVKPKKAKTVKVRITTTYSDTKLQRLVNAGEVITVPPERAEVIIKAGFGEIR